MTVTRYTRVDPSSAGPYGHYSYVDPDPIIVYADGASPTVPATSPPVADGTDASALTTGYLDPARILDASIPWSKIVVGNIDGGLI